MFIPIWGRFPFWLIFFRWVETTNQAWLFEYILAHQSFLVMPRKSPCDLIARSEDPFSILPFSLECHVSVRRCGYGQDHLVISCCIDILNSDEYCWQRFLCWVRLTVCVYVYIYIDDFLFRPWGFVPKESCVLGVWRLQVWWDIPRTYILCVYPSRRGKILKPLYCTWASKSNGLGGARFRPMLMNWKPMELKYATTARMRSGSQNTGIIVIMMDLGRDS